MPTGETKQVDNPQDLAQGEGTEQERNLTKEDIESRYKERLEKLDALVLRLFGDRSVWASMKFDAMMRERNAKIDKVEVILDSQERNARVIAGKYHQVQTERLKELEKIGLTIQSNGEAQENTPEKSLESMLDEI